MPTAPNHETTAEGSPKGRRRNSGEKSQAESLRTNQTPRPVGRSCRQAVVDYAGKGLNEPDWVRLKIEFVNIELHREVLPDEKYQRNEDKRRHDNLYPEKGFGVTTALEELEDRLVVINDMDKDPDDEDYSEEGPPKDHLARRTNQYTV